MRHIDDDRAATLGWILRAIYAEAGVLRQFDEACGLAHGFGADVLDAHLIHDLVAGSRRKHRRNVGRAVQKTGDVAGVIVLGRKRERLAVRRPACHPRLKLGPQVAAYVQITCARPAEQPFHGAAGGEIETKLANIQWNSARRLVNVGDHFGAHIVGAARDRRKILNVGTAKADVRHRDECGLSVNRCQQLVQRHGNAVIGGDGNKARAGSLVNVEVRGEIHFLGNDLVSLLAPIEAGQHDRLADGYVLLHHHLAGSGEVVMQQNVSICQAIVLSCFDWSQKRNKIVTEEMNFPSNLYIYQRAGARLVTVPSNDGITVPLDKLLAAIDGETALVSVSHVCFRSSYIQDLAAITRRAHDVGAKVVADIYQSAGTVPLNVRELGLDFATGGSVKWLLGGPGAGYLYVRRDLWPELEPRVTGWAAHREPFSFSAEHDYAGNVSRFLNGTPNVPAMFAARSGYEIVDEVGVENIRAKSMRQTARLIELAEDAGFRVNCPKNPAERGGTVVIDVPHGLEVTRELLRRDYLVDYRPGAGIRVAPHFYSPDEELE